MIDSPYFGVFLVPQMPFRYLIEKKKVLLGNGLLDKGSRTTGSGTHICWGRREKLNACDCWT